MERHHADRFKVYASTALSDLPKSVDAAKERMRRVEDADKKRAMATISGRTIDYSWLKGASETYQISPDIKNYVLTEVPIVTIGFPNRNLHCFPYEEVSYFDPRFGKFIYQTFIGKPTFADHDNRDFTKAKGIHFDATLRKVPGWDVWKIYVLLGYCREKDPVLASKIEKGQRRGYSMGAWVSYFVNSLTGQVTNGNKACKYPKGSVHDGILSYDICTGVDYFETSSVESPADVSAESHQLWYF